jgi:hypothetical protein
MAMYSFVPPSLWCAVMCLTNEGVPRVKKFAEHCFKGLSMLKLPLFGLEYLIL